MSHTGRMPEVKNRMFTLHPLFTTYHSEIKGENRKVNSVNSSFEKKFFMWIKDALVWIRATAPNLLIKNDLTFRFIDGLKIDWSEKQWGHKRGHISLLCFIICFLSLTYFDV
ncbi:integrase [Escherichia coli]|nr:integrase [Escherichia coli]